MSNSGLGWRARIGFIGPQDAIEHPTYQFYQMAPPGVSQILTLLGIAELSATEMDSALGRMGKCAEILSGKGADVIVQAGVPYIVRKEYGYHTKISEEISSKLGKPFVTDIGAIIKALQTLAVERIVVVTPFSAEINGHLERYLKEAGFDVRLTYGEDLFTSKKVGTAPLEYSYKLVREAMALVGSNADAIYVPCGCWLFADNIRRVEEDFGIPVVFATQAMIWACLRIINIKTQVKGYGRLWEEF